MNIIWEKNMQNKLGNVIIEIQSGASLHVRKGWGNVLSSIGFNVIYYNIESGIPINDIFDRLGDVKLFLGTTYNLNRPLIRQILKRPEMKIALYCSGHGQLIKEIDLKNYPIQVISQEEHINFDYIKNQVGAVHIHIDDSLVDGYIGGWNKDFGVKTVGIMNAYDKYGYKDCVYKEKYTADVGFVGGGWIYKFRNLDKSLVRLCREEWKNLNIKVYGNGWGDLAQYLGTLPIFEDGSVFLSSKICPNISEPHSTDYGFDLVERIFKVPGVGGFLISDNVKEIKSVFPNNEVPVFDNYEEFRTLIYYYIKYEEERVELAKKQQEIILAKHTYNHRMNKLLKNIGMEKEAELCLNLKI